jgi:iron complex outermembrane receptor protein
LQLTWGLTENLELFGGVASSVRTPDPQELYIGLQRPMGKPNWVGNPDLDPTRNNQIDLGAKISGESYYLNASVFYSYLDDFINVTSISAENSALPPARSYVNIDAKMYGGELAGQAALPLDLYFTGSLSYVRGKDRDSKENLSEIPPLMGNVALRYDVGTYFVEITERFSDKQTHVDDSLNEEETPGWAVTDIKAGAELGRWTITGGVNNVFDKFYETYLSYQRDPFSSGVKVPETGAFGYLTVACTF